MKSIINVSNRMPVTVGETIEKSSGGLVSALEGVEGRFNLKWVGWPGASIDEKKEQEKIEKTLVNNYGYVPVFLSEEEIDHFYLGFSNSSLWPILHYMPNFMRYTTSWWETYIEVNERFADKVLQIAEEDDIIWVHDYHLMLLPKILRERKSDLRIGYFLHTPFPSYEVFRCHPNREDLVAGILGADVIGFHTFGYLRHFRSSVLRLLGYDSEMDHIPHSNRKTYINIFPIGINSEKFINILETPEFKEKQESLLRIYKGKKIVLGVERLDYTKGILRRLDAVEQYLESTGDNNIVFIFISVPSREAVPEYQELIERVESRVGKINGNYATVENSPIHFIHQSVDFHELAALYSLADAALVTPVIDGMNLVAKEYVACQRDSRGVLILSEFAGSAEELFNSLMINPYNINQMADHLETAFSMEAKEKKRRMEMMREHVLKFDSKHWATSFIKEMERRTPQEDTSTKPGKLVQDILESISEAQKIGFFIDYDGTLMEFQSNPKAAVPDAGIKDLLSQLEKGKNIDVYVISGRDRDDLEEWLGDLEVTLVAEHGFFYRERDEKDWKNVIENADFSWKETIREIFQLYEGTTPGSFIEEKRSSLVWHYRKCDPELGRFKAKQLMGELYEMISNLPVEIHHGQKIVEVSSMQINKGAAVSHFNNIHGYDVIVCAGDDQTDENMFRLENKNQFNIKVGNGMTNASFRVKDPAQLRNLLSGIVNTLQHHRG